tara:strand:- start:80395 stop:80829 length:435 start_codon:yes stop_codon:yes gene_type:complete
MLLGDKKGIICDFCGLTYKEKFSYYPVETVKIKVVNSMTVGKSTAKFDKDVCDQCYADLLAEVEKNLGTCKRGFIKCDLSKTQRNGTFNYYIMNFHKVTVDVDAEPTSEVERQVMDLNVIDGFDALAKKVEVAREKTNKQGGWS